MALAVLGVMMVATVVGVVAMDDDGAADAAVSDTFTVGDLEYEVIADGEVEVSDTTSAYISGDLVIPSSVSDGTEQYSVTSIGVNAFWNCYGLTSVTIPNSVTSIGNYAFTDCSGLTSVTIPNSVTSIENSTFSGCSGLTSVNIGNSVTSIGDNAFYYCTNLTSVTIPDSVTSIGNYAFQHCSGLTSVNIGNSVTSIGNYAFIRCTNLTSVTIPDSVTSIEGSAFQLCSGLTSVTFTSQDPPTMGRYAFDTRTTLLVTSHWDPVTAMADAIGTSGKTTIVWANPPYPDLTFESDPVADGIIAYVTRETP